MGAAYLLSLFLFTAAARAQDLTAPLGIDPEVHAGKLPNGLTFLIRRNALPANRVILRLVVKAGSIDEADDQRGLAHMLEHMAFNGSTHFKSGELVKYLESIGARFGADVNAYTSFDETVFMLEMPSDKDENVQRGLDALSDFAGGLTLDPAEIDRERGVVIEEWRGRQGAGTRMQAAQMSAMYGASRYVDRVPIGLPDTIRSFTPERLRAFYQTYYRPDRMAVVAVGDFDPQAMEKNIRDHFSGLRAVAPAERTVYPLPLNGGSVFTSLSDREAQGSSVSLMYKRPAQKYRVTADYRRSVVDTLAHQMLDSRLAEIARRPDAPFLRASSGEDTLGPNVESFSISARVNDGAIAKGLEAIGEEVARLRQQGFGDGELDRAKRDEIATYERAYNERDKAQSPGFASELVRYFLTDEPIPGIEAELALMRQFLPTITAEETSAAIRDHLIDENRVILAIAPDKEGLPMTTEASLREALAAGTSAKVEAWHDAVDGRVLLAKVPTPGTVKSTRQIPDLGVTVLTLSNGVEVWLKPTDFRNDQISFTGYSKGGTSLASPADYLNASLSTSLVGLAGVGGFNPIDLGKLLAGTISNASTFMGTYTHGVSGGSTPKDLEIALQLTYLLFTSPNHDAAAFDLMKRRIAANLANQNQSPGAVFGDRVRRLNTGDHYTVRPMQPGDVDHLDPDRMFAYYQERFKNAADFTFFFVGAFNVEQITPLLAKYLGSLPSTGTSMAESRDLGLMFPTMMQRETVMKGKEPKSQTAITFFTDTKLDELDTHRLRAATSILEIRLRDTLREELGGTYSVGVGYSDTSPQPGYGTTSVQFGSSPENAERLTSVVMAELEKLRKDGPTAAEVQTVKEAEKRDLETSVKQNGYWLNSLQAMHLLGRDPLSILRRTERTESLSQENIHAVLEKYFPTDRYTVVTLMPEASGTPIAAR
jgi:zinc protease